MMYWLRLTPGESTRPLEKQMLQNTLMPANAPLYLHQLTKGNTVPPRGIVDVLVVLRRRLIWVAIFAARINHGIRSVIHNVLDAGLLAFCELRGREISEASIGRQMTLDNRLCIV